MSRAWPAVLSLAQKKWRALRGKMHVCVGVDTACRACVTSKQHKVQMLLLIHPMRLPPKPNPA